MVPSVAHNNGGTNAPMLFLPYKTFSPQAPEAIMVVSDPIEGQKADKNRG